MANATSFRRIQPSHLLGLTKNRKQAADQDTQTKAEPASSCMP